MIKTIDTNDEKILFELINLQKASYQIEAELIQYFDIPPLKESIEDLMASKENFFGYLEDEMLVGSLSYIVDGNELDICRLIVHPHHFRKGIAQKLLTHVERLYTEINVLKVSTGRDNTPAKELYLKNNYQFVCDHQVAPGFFISQFEKRGL